MDPALALHRFHFAFTATFHYLFPQLTMGLALLIVVLKTIGRRTGDPRYDEAAHFWGKIFAINFAIGVVTGIPMEFQFGTSWSRFAKAAGGVIGQTLAMEGVFAFFLESSFLGAFLFGRRILGATGHYVAAIAVWLGSWLSGYFIIATDAWMQHPVAYTMAPDGRLQLDSFWSLLSNPWIFAMYAHNMLGAVVTASFVMTGIGAYYLLMNRHQDFGRIFVRVGVPAGLIAAVLIAFPTGDAQGKNVGLHQPATLAAMEGLFSSENGAPLAILGQPDMEKKRLDNPIIVPKALSLVLHRDWTAKVKGLADFSVNGHPDNVPLLYYAFHIMVGLGTLFIVLTGIAAVLLWRGVLFTARPLLWALMLAMPFPYIANTAGWMTAEIGRQPWLIYGLMRTSEGSSANVSSGNALFTLLGFLGMYLVLGILFLFLLSREIERGPENVHLSGIESDKGTEVAVA